MRAAGFRSAALAVLRAVVLTVAVATPLVVWPGAADPFALPKLTVVVLAALAVLAVSALRAIRLRAIVVPYSPVLAAGTVFIVIAVLATLLGDDLWRSVLGQRGRATGLALYGASAILLFAVVRSFDSRSVAHIANAFVGGAAVVAVIGLVQALGGDFGGFRLYGEEGFVFATLGNPNFAAGFLGIALPLSLRAVLSSREPVAWRVASGGLATVILAVIVATRSLQGVLAALAGVAVLVTAWLLDQPPLTRRAGLAGVWGGGAAFAAAIGAGVAGIGPLAGMASDVSVAERLTFWRTAARMLGEQPLVGVGFDLYGSYYRLFRPVSAALGVSLAAHTDSPHNVPLGMFAEGGIVLGLAWVAFAVTTAVLVFLGFRRLQGQQRLLLGAVAGAWLAYHVQAVVSIDVPALAVAHWLLAGAIAVLVPGGVRFVPVLGSERQSDKRKRRARDRVTSVMRASMTGVVVVALLAAWVVTRPLRADIAAGHGEAAERTGLPEVADAAFARASHLMPLESAYWLKMGQALARRGAMEPALAAFERAAEVESRSFSSTLNAARTASALERGDDAIRWYDRSLRLEPTAPALKQEAAAVFLDFGEAARAVTVLEEAVSLDPTNSEYWALLGDAKLQQGARDGARRAFERAVALDPSNASAQAQLAELAQDT